MIALRDTRLTHSQIQTTMTCPRKGYLAYALGLRREVDAKPLRIGRAVHEALELAGKGMFESDAILQAVAPDTAFGDGDSFSREIERQTAMRMLATYFWYWRAKTAELGILETEHVFEIPIVNPDSGRTSRTYTLAGKIDKIVGLPDGRLAVMEHKTTSSDLDITGDYWRRLRIDSQVSIYYLAAKQRGYNINTTLYDVMRKPGIQPKQIPLLDEAGLKIVLDENKLRVFKKDGLPRQSGDAGRGYVLQTRTETPEEFGDRLALDMAERPDWYFCRREVVRTADDIEDARHELWQYTKTLRDCERYGRWPRNTRSCIGFGRCPYFDLCVDHVDVESGGVPDGYMVVDDVHQELIEGE